MPAPRVYARIEDVQAVHAEVVAVKEDVAELKDWLKPLRNGAGAKVSKVTYLVDLAEKGQAHESNRQTLNAAAEILFGWIPSNFRKVGGALAILFTLFGGLSSIGWAILSAVQIWHLFHPH